MRRWVIIVFCYIRNNSSGVSYGKDHWRAIAFERTSAFRVWKIFVIRTWVSDTLLPKLRL